MQIYGYNITTKFALSKGRCRETLGVVAGKYTYKVDAHQATQVISLNASKTSVRIKTSPGECYTVEVQAITTEGAVFAAGRIQFKAGNIMGQFYYI
jgi:hypothetical protein